MILIMLCTIFIVERCTEDSVIIFPTATPTADLETPTGFTATSGDGQITLDWDEADGLIYNVYWTNDGTTPSLESDNVLEDIDAGFIHSELINGVEYCYILAAQNDGRISSPTDSICATPMPDYVDPPTELWANADCYFAYFNWNEVTDPITQYNLYYTTDGSDPQIGGGNTTQVVDAESPVMVEVPDFEACNASFKFMVTCVNMRGEGSPSSIIAKSASVPNYPPDAGGLCWNESASNPVIDKVENIHCTQVLYDPHNFGNNDYPYPFRMYADSKPIALLFSEDGYNWVNKINIYEQEVFIGTPRHNVTLYNANGFEGHPSQYKFLMWYWTLGGGGCNIHKNHYILRSIDGITWEYAALHGDIGQENGTSSGSDPYYDIDGVVPGNLDGTVDKWDAVLIAGEIENPGNTDLCDSCGTSYAGAQSVIYQENPVGTIDGVDNDPFDHHYVAYFGTSVNNTNMGYSDDGQIWYMWEGTVDCSGGTPTPRAITSNGDPRASWTINQVSGVVRVAKNKFYGAIFGGGNAQYFRGVYFIQSTDGVSWSVDSTAAAYPFHDCGATPCTAGTNQYGFINNLININRFGIQSESEPEWRAYYSIMEMGASNLNGVNLATCNP